MIENEMVKRYLKNGRLTLIPRKEKKKMLLFRYMAENSFDRGACYTEKEVNERLSAYYHDYAIIRRYMVGYGILKRNDEGSCYQLGK